VKLQNRHGDPVDPVPAIVVTGMGALVSVSFFPVYVMELGYGPELGVVIAAVLTLAVAVAAYYRLVWTARPDVRGEIPAGDRLRRMAYAAVAVVVTLFGLSLPFFTL
jgi:hypothetical protein